MNAARAEICQPSITDSAAATRLGIGQCDKPDCGEQIFNAASRWTGST